jgi:hypothetical protein
VLAYIENLPEDEKEVSHCFFERSICPAHHNLNNQQLKLCSLRPTEVSVAGCLGYDVLVILDSNNSSIYE